MEFFFVCFFALLIAYRWKYWSFCPFPWSFCCSLCGCFTGLLIYYRDMTRLDGLQLKNLRSASSIAGENPQRILVILLLAKLHTAQSYGSFYSLHHALIGFTNYAAISWTREIKQNRLNNRDFRVLSYVLSFAWSVPCTQVEFSSER